MMRTTETTKKSTNKTTTPPLCAVVAADDKELRSFLARTLRGSGYDVVEIADSLALLLFFKRVATTAEGPATLSVDLVVSDIAIPGRTALDILAEFRRVVHNVPVVLITAFDDKKTLQAAIDMGATAVFDKPFDIEEFKSFLAESVSQSLCQPKSGLEIA